MWSEVSFLMIAFGHMKLWVRADTEKTGHREDGRAATSGNPHTPIPVRAARCEELWEKEKPRVRRVTYDHSKVFKQEPIPTQEWSPRSPWDPIAEQLWTRWAPNPTFSHSSPSSKMRGTMWERKSRLKKSVYSNSQDFISINFRYKKH